MRTLARTRRPNQSSSQIAGLLDDLGLGYGAPVSTLDQGEVNTAEAIAGVIVLGLVGWGIYATTRKSK